MENLRNIIRRNKASLIVFAAIFSVGIFLRVYNFNGLLVFGFDQSRDAQLANNIIENHQSLPLLGPHAMGTRFKLGPAYYYFQYLSAVIFGDRPQSLAYPDLLFSIATIPLLFFFLRKYFNKDVSLALAGLWSISFFAVKFSRFAWNPNSLPFFTLLLLYALLEIADSEKGRHKNWWLAVAGIALGVGVQLHTLSLVILPVVAVLFIWSKVGLKERRAKYIAIIFAAALLLNVPQVVSEMKTGGRNTRDFIVGVKEELRNHTDLATNLFADVSCHVQANSLIVSSYGDNVGCSFGDIFYKQEGGFYYASLLGKIAFAFAFSVFGYLALFSFWKKPPAGKNDDFIRLISMFVAVSFLAFFMVAVGMTDRYYLVFAFVPIVLLGLIYERFLKKIRYGKSIFIIMLLVLAVQNAVTLKKYFTPFERIGLMEDSMLSENRALANFISVNVGTDRKAYISQKQGDWRILNYFLTGKVYLIHIGKNSGFLDQSVPYFLITDEAHKKTIIQAEQDLFGYAPAKQASFGTFIITEFLSQK